MNDLELCTTWDIFFSQRHKMVLRNNISDCLLDKDDDDSTDRDRKDRKDDRKSSKERSSKDKVGSMCCYRHVGEV